ncbi:MAG: LysR family transcriptional regulator [Acutalibacter sp.]|nr:LysR family transcriptional regulator [Acutalibacter sp.]
MDLRVLEYFLMTAEEGSITHAAELLHVSQPTVSRQLMDLERELGKTLLIRTKKNVSLTKDGLLFRETAREIIALYQKAVREDASAGELSGDLYIGMGETGSVRFLAQEIAAFQTLYPGVHFHLISENADRICEDIEKGLLDAGLVMRNVNSSTFEILELGLTETWGVLVPEGHPLVAEPEVSGKMLRQERLILPENTVFKQELLRWLGQGTEERVRATYNLIFNAFPLARAASALIVCLGTVGERQEGMIFLPFAKSKTASASLIWKKKPVQTPALEAFLEYVTHAIPE